MLIKSFSVKNYRSITKSERLPFYDLSILLGPNNEGKSNILNALLLALKGIESGRFTSRRIRFHSYKAKRYYMARRPYYREFDYDWKRDFPLKLQDSMPNGTSNFELEIELNKEERKYFSRATRHKMKGNLIIAVLVGENSFEARIYDSIDKKKDLTDFDVWEFLSRIISIQYITAIRTSKTSRQVIEDMIEKELEILTKKKEYKKLIEKINRIERPHLKKISKSLTKSIINFLPDVKKIEIQAEEKVKRFMRADCDIFVDDGTKTNLDLKGDGIKSILAISVIQYVAQQKALGKNIILAIEEPESHLHPLAIHKFKKVLEEIAKNNQVIITTHSPLLVNRSNPKKNLLVYKSKAVVAKDVSEIRDILGVQISDNLVSANLIILVEGEEDTKVLKAWISDLSTKVKLALENRIIVFDDLGGSSNLSYKITQWKNLLCDVFVFLDNDKSGNKAYTSAEEKGLITDKEVFFANVQGMPESEIEDMININIYKSKINSDFGVKLEGRVFRRNRGKWSDRIKETFRSKGKRWSKKLQGKVKKIVSEETSRAGSKSLKEVCKPCIISFVKTIENYLILKRQ